MPMEMTLVLNMSNTLTKKLADRIASGVADSLSEKLGKKICVQGMEKHGATHDFYSFPTPFAVFEAGEQFLFDLKTGFRAKYITDAAKKWVDGGMKETPEEMINFIMSFILTF